MPSPLQTRRLDRADAEEEEGDDDHMLTSRAEDAARSAVKVKPPHPRWPRASSLTERKICKTTAKRNAETTPPLETKRSTAPVVESRVVGLSHFSDIRMAFYFPIFTLPTCLYL